MAEEVVIASMRDASEMVTDAKVADVKALFDTHVNDGKVIVVVEGADDVDVFGKVMDAGSVCFYPDCNCDKHVVILSALNGRYENRLLAIKDADFDRLDGMSYPYVNLLLTDTHDMEGMIVADCLPRLQGDDAVRCQGITLVPIYSELEDISYLKWFNHATRSRLCFKGVIPDMVFTDYFNAVVANTDADVTVTIADVVFFKSQHPGAPEKDLCNGHDIFERVYVRAKAANVANFPKKPFFRRLRAAYPKEKFKNTSLFRAIRAWEVANSQAILAVT